MFSFDLRDKCKTMMELVLDLDNLSPDIDNDEKERRMALLSPNRHVIKSFFNVPDKDDGDERDDGDIDGDDEEERSMAALALAWRHWSIRHSSFDGDGDKCNGDEGNGDEGDGDGDGNNGGCDTEQVMKENGILILNDYGEQSHGEATLVIYLSYTV